MEVLLGGVMNVVEVMKDDVMGGNIDDVMGGRHIGTI